MDIYNRIKHRVLWICIYYKWKLKICENKIIYKKKTSRYREDESVC